MPLAPLPPQHLLHPDATSPGGCRFILERQLSAGGFAITYLAWDQQFRDRCVIKELAIDELMSRSGLAMLPLPGRADEVASWLDKAQEEAVTLHRLRNAGVVPVRATWRENGTAYFAMDFIDGIELPAEPMQGVTWSTWEPVARKLLTALGAIHEAGLIHGDIKPENVLVTREGRPVVIDFGTARTSGEARTSRLATAAMTPGYCPPELAVRNRADELGPWSDLYSWAITVMGLAVRHQGVDGRPLDANARVALALHGIADGGLGASTASALHEAGLSSEWVAALMSCVALDPKKRPASVEAILARLDAPSEPKTAELRVSDALWPIVPAAEAMEPSDASPSRAGPHQVKKAGNGGVALIIAALLLATAAAFWGLCNSPSASRGANGSAPATSRTVPSLTPKATAPPSPTTPDAATAAPAVPAVPAVPTVPTTTAPPPPTVEPPAPPAAPAPAPTETPSVPEAPPTAAPARPADAAPAVPSGARPRSLPSLQARPLRVADARARILASQSNFYSAQPLMQETLKNITTFLEQHRCPLNLSCSRQGCNELVAQVRSFAASAQANLDLLLERAAKPGSADRAEAIVLQQRRAQADLAEAYHRMRTRCEPSSSH